MITAYRWNHAERTGGWIDAGQLAASIDSIRGGSDVWWIDLQAATPEEEALVLQNLLPVHALTLEDITKPRREPDALPHFPKVEEFPDYLFAIVNPLAHLPSEMAAGRPNLAPRGCTRQLSAIITHNALVTHHYDPLSSIKELTSYLNKHSHQCERGPDYLFHIVLDSMVDDYGPTLDRIEDRLEQVEDEVFLKPTPALLAHLLELKRDIIALRKTLIYEREVLARLQRGEFALIDDRERVYYRNVYDHLIRYAELVEGSREMVTDLMQTHLAAVSNKMNEIMKALTMISTIVLPMSLVAGVYGMNFKVWFPELEWTLGYPFALTLMAITGFCGYAMFKWRRWI